MLLLLSPAKKQSFNDAPVVSLPHATPIFLQHTKTLVAVMKEKTISELEKLMSISTALAKLNRARFIDFDQAPMLPAIFAFQGDVYQGLSAKTLSEDMIEFAQDHMLILSGLYGLLRPLDDIQPHRLEMGISLVLSETNNLYEYWSSIITDAINQRLSEDSHPILINLASQEYFKAVQIAKLNYPLIHIVFKEYRDGEYRIIPILAKRARGKMARYIISQKLNEPEAIKQFNVDGYQFSAKHSTPDQFLFLR